MESGLSIPTNSSPEVGKVNVVGLPHLVTVRNLTRMQMEAWMTRADTLRQMSRRDRNALHSGAVVATLFYEPSTRTRLSFETAVLQLGGQVIGAENAKENSSAKKGETLADVVRVVGAYADVIVIRHHDAEAFREATRFSPVPLVSAGAGDGEHPTQAMLDIYTMMRELGRIDGLHIAILGDLKYGRTVHSLLWVLTRFRGVRVSLLPEPGFSLPQEELRLLSKAGLTLQIATQVETLFPTVDVVYQTRIQRERLQDEEASGFPGDTNRTLTTGSIATTAGCSVGTLNIGIAELQLLPHHAKIMHPLPRVGEIDPAIDEDPRAAYFRQVENGLYMRMAILDQLLGGQGL
ncbi:aspartate carbamoyltransferase [Alicyclobacillaceae bacterium I2511]|nr:aspartate carbamoyltransferase [Alicyclobacillaceae bacterium I2511]